MKNNFVVVVTNLWSNEPDAIRYFFNKKALFYDIESKTMLFYNSNTNLTKITDYKTKFKFLCLAIYES